MYKDSLANESILKGFSEDSKSQYYWPLTSKYFQTMQNLIDFFKVRLSEISVIAHTSKMSSEYFQYCFMLFKTMLQFHIETLTGYTILCLMVHPGPRLPVPGRDRWFLWLPPSPARKISKWPSGWGYTVTLRKSPEVMLCFSRNCWNLYGKNIRSHGRSQHCCCQEGLLPYVGLSIRVGFGPMFYAHFKGW